MMTEERGVACAAPFFHGAGYGLARSLRPKRAIRQINNEVIPNGAHKEMSSELRK